MRVADHEAVHALQRLAHGRELGLGLLAGDGRLRCRLIGAHRRRRAIGPDLVDRVRVDRHELRAAGLRRLGEALDLPGRMQPGVVAQPRAFGEVVLEPALRRHVEPGLRRETAVSTCSRTCTV